MEKYQKPVLEVINLELEQSILSDSGNSSSTYSLLVDDKGYADDDDW